jgi:hypothetical protein
VRKVWVIALVAAFGFAATSCQVGVRMWGSCADAPKDDQFGTDVHYVLHCEGGRWKPIMTVDEYAKVLLHQPVVIAPLPTEPEPTTPVAPTMPPAGCYVDGSRTHGDLYFAGRVLHGDDAVYSSSNGSCTGSKTVGTAVFAGDVSAAFDLCVGLGEQGVSPGDLSAYGDAKLTELWACLGP